MNDEKNKVNVLFDKGSTQTFITKSLVDKLSLPKLKKVNYEMKGDEYFSLNKMFKIIKWLIIKRLRNRQRPSFSLPLMNLNN